MKSISIALLVLFVASVAFADTGPPYAGDVMCNQKYPFQPHRTFRFVRWMPTTMFDIREELTADSVVIWDTNSDDGVTVTTTTTSKDSRVAGVVVAAIRTPDSTNRTVTEDIGKRNWGWLQTYGLADNVRLGLTAVVTNSYIGTGESIGEAGPFLDVRTSDVTTRGVLGFSLNSGPLDGTVAVFLKCE